MDATQTGADDDVKASPNPRNDVVKQIAQQVHAAQAEEFHEFDEDNGIVHPKEPQKDPPKDPEEEQEDERPRDESGRFVSTKEEPDEVKEPPKEEPKKFKVKVYGQEAEVDQDELIRGYQISEAARRQLEAANATKRQLEEALARIGQTPVQQGEAQPNTMAEGRLPAIPPPELISAIVRHEVEQNEAVAQFKREFPDIANDPVLYREAIAREDQRLRDIKLGIRDPNEPLASALKEHGNAIRAWVKKVATPATTDKAARKSSIQSVPSASVKAPAPVEDKPKSAADIINDLRKARGQKPI